MARNHTTMCPPGIMKRRILYILVMGITGVGKSTFISVATEIKDIPIGVPSNMDGVTVEVQDYVLFHLHKGILYEIHLIDSPGFDDGSLGDSQVLAKIATYVNTNYKLKQRLAGVLYLYDITKDKVGGTQRRNLRMLEKMIGHKKYSNCTLVTTKWGCTTDPQAEEDREETLRSEKKFFGEMLENAGHATLKRFDPKTKATALDIITPYLDSKFTPEISYEMVDPSGPKLALGETEAGKVIADNLEKLTQAKQDLKRMNIDLEKVNIDLKRVNIEWDILSQKYDETLFADFKQKRKELRRKIRTQKSVRWIMRTSIVGGAIVATVLTAGPGASIFALEPVFEKAVARQRKGEKKKKESLKAEFVKESQNANRLKEIDPAWLEDKHVESLDDLRKYSLRSESSDSDILKIVKRGEVVRIAASESSEGLLDPANWKAMSETSESDDFDAEGWDLDDDDE